MITDDQVVELFAQANPIPTLKALEADSVVEVGAEESTSERSRTMVTVKSEEPGQQRRRRPLLVGALGVALAAVVALSLILTGDQTDVATPAGAEEEAIETALDFFAALTAGDVDGVMALMAPELAEPEFNRPAFEFFAALPGTKTLSQCTVTEGFIGVGVSCQTHFSGPLMQATAPDSTATFSVEDGLLTTFARGSLDEAGEAFVEYASQTRPEEYEQACSPRSYEVASVRTSEAGFALAGPCGELWAQVAEDAAAWVEAGRPSLSEDN